MQMDINTKKAIREAGWQIDEVAFDKLSAYQQEFTRQELTLYPRNLEYYKERLNQLGFSKSDNILDAACGIGQWSIALSLLNKQVVGVDISKERIAFAKSLVHINQIDNCSFLASSIEAMPFEESTFDKVFCYGSFMFTNMPVCLAEFNRVMKKGSHLYLNANSIGWYLHLLIDKGIRQGQLHRIRDFIRYSINTILQQNQAVIVTRNYLKKLAVENGFAIVDINTEGHIGNPNSIPPIYPSSFYGKESIIEVILEKRG